ncbi:MAG: prolipoprotein diacylglyceryl transferase family protein [Owenweeksia sp.]|nr:prolipoprotein diacylglyceryl transferase family protein [Owenweeksia sp.]
MYSLDIWFKRRCQHDRAETALRQRMAPYLNGLDVEDRNIIFPQHFAINWDLDQPNLAHVEVMGMPRYPTQLYEALAYFLIFLILYRLYLIKGLAIRQGFLFGSFLILVFGFRFFIEYYKEVQVAAEKGQSLNIGQYLSIPLVAAGIALLLIAKPKEYDQGHP